MLINSYVMHVLDKTSSEPTLSSDLGVVTAETDKYVQKLIKKVLKDEDMRKGVFKEYNDNVVKNCCEQILYKEDFIGHSNELATHLFNVVSCAGDMTSGILVVCDFAEKEEEYVAIIKLDYKEIFEQSVVIGEDGECTVEVISNPQSISDRIKQAVIVGLNGINDDYHLRFLDKDAEKEETDTAFIRDFLDVTKVVDDKYKTKMFIKRAENWITNAMGTDVKKAEDAKSLLVYTLKEKDALDVDVFASNVGLDADLKESLKEYLEENNIGDTFEIDKPYVEKKLKKRNIKMDNGFKISGDLCDFDDPMKYSIRKNENGSTDVVIKNVNFIEG